MNQKSCTWESIAYNVNFFQVSITNRLTSTEKKLDTTLDLSQAIQRSQPNLMTHGLRKFIDTKDNEDNVRLGTLLDTATTMSITQFCE